MAAIHNTEQKEDAGTGFEQFARVLFLLGCFTVPLLSLRLVGDNVTVSDGFFGLNLVVLAVFGRRQQQLPPIGARQVAAFLILLGGLLAGFLADSTSSSLIATARLLYIVLIWPWQARGSLTSRALVRKATIAWVAGSALFAFYNIYEAKFNAAAASDNGRIAGLVGHVTDAGGVLTIVFPFLLGLLITGRKKLLAGVALAADGAALILTGSVSGYITVAIATLATLWVLRRRLTFVGILSGAVLVFAAVKGASLLQIRSDLGISIFSRLQATTSGRYDTLGMRERTYSYAIDHLQLQPLIGRGMDPSSGMTVQGLLVHNMLLLLWYQGGLLTLAGMLVFIVHVVRRGRRLEKADVLAGCLKLSLFAALLFAMTSPLSSQRYLWMPAVLLLALGYTSTARAQAPPEVPAVPSGRRSPAGQPARSRVRPR